MIDRWGDEIMVAHGEVFRPHEHAGFVASVEDRVAGVFKPSIPPLGDHGIAIRDEIELEMAL